MRCSVGIFEVNLFFSFGVRIEEVGLDTVGDDTNER